MATDNDPERPSGDILVVDDEIPNLQLLLQLLSAAGYRVRPCELPQVAIESARSQPPDLILLDVRMPAMDGFEVCRRLKQDERTRAVPVIFVSALQDVQDRVRGFEAGGVDFISKPFQEVEVLARVRTHLALRKMTLHLEEMVAERTADLTLANRSLRTEIDERNRAEAALEESRRFTDHLIETANVMIVGLDLQGRVTLVNPAVTRVTGYTASELYGNDWFALLVPSADSEAVHREFARLVAGGEPEQYENPIRAKGGAERMIAWRNTRLDVAQHPVGLLSFGIDVTSRVQAETAVRESRDYLARLTDSIADIVFSARMPERIIEWTNPAIRQLGYEPNECLGRQTDFLYADPQEFAAIGEAMAHASAQGLESLRREVMLKRKDRTILPADAIASFFRIDGQLISTTVILRDISERHEKERRLRDYQARLKALAAELTVSEERERRRIAAVLHDGPVQTLAFARMQLGAAMQQADAGERTRALDEVSESLLQAGLDTSRVVADLASPILDELGLSAAISDWAQEQVHRRFGIEVRVQSDLAEGEERGLDELTRMVLFRNLRELLTNAVKHARATRIDVRLEQIEDAIRLSVGDDGAGCDVAAALAGTSDAGGFGLFSIRERMADLGGSLEIESSPGEGFTAVMTLPRQHKSD